MRNSPKDYPSVHSWNFITIEGYCLLNVEYGRIKDRHAYILKPGVHGKRRRMTSTIQWLNRNPTRLTARVLSAHGASGAWHFAWCDPDPDLDRCKKSYPP